MLTLLKKTYRAWVEDHVQRMSAALAFYMLFALAPIVIFGVKIAGIFLQEQEVRDMLYQRLEDVVGMQGVDFVQSLVVAIGQQSVGLVGTVVIVVLLLLALMRVASELRNALNRVWNVETPHPPFLHHVRSRLFAFVLLVVFGALVALTLLLHVVLASAQGFFAAYGVIATPAWQVASNTIAVGALVIFFAVIYKVLPQAHVAWRDVFVGAGVSALLFAVAQFFISVYFAHSSITGTYGAGSTVVLVLLWLYYSAHVFYFGAEFTYAYAATYGSKKTDL